jgi:UDP-N-acetylglucosamine--N-acetylmuramyl-(pentapeptide) pyrophosphoryl-undecaprenol N-acetylglucosamine transferase
MAALDKDSRAEIQVIHLTGAKDYELAVKAYSLIDGLDARVYSFIDRIEEAYSASELIITRAGSSAIFEAAYFARPMILVPYPLASAHQSENARVFALAGAAIVIEEKNLSAEVFKDNILKLRKDKELLGNLGSSAKRLSSAGAASKLAREVLILSER